MRAIPATSLALRSPTDRDTVFNSDGTDIRRIDARL